MIAFGGTIGAGIFLSSGRIIADVGPLAALCYAVVGVMAAGVMRLLSSLTQRDPDVGAFATHAGMAFGRIGRFVVGWMYWWLLIVAIGVQGLAVAAIGHQWLPDVPRWGWAVLVVGVFAAVNLGSVRFFGECQFWLAAIKIAVCATVPTLTVLAILGVFRGTVPPGLSNVTEHGGLVPHGVDSFLTGIPVAVFSFTGIEMAAIAATEADRPSRVAAKSLRLVTYVVLTCYVLQVVTTVVLLPWNSPRVAASPFAAVLLALRIPAGATVINVAVFTAILSVLNSCLYSSSRIGMSLAEHGDAPRVWRRAPGSRGPTSAVVSAGAIGVGIILLGEVLPGNVFAILVDSSGAVGLMIWLAITVSYLKLAPPSDSLPRQAAITSRRLRCVALAITAVVIALLVAMFFLAQTQLQMIATSIPVMVIVIVVLVLETNRSADREM